MVETEHPRPRLPQITIGRLLLVTLIVAAVLAIAPNVYHSRQNNWSGILSIVLTVTLGIGAVMGLLVGGIESMFRGIIAGALIYLMAMAVLVCLALLGLLN